jgi:hypothetical protein
MSSSDSVKAPVAVFLINCLTTCVPPSTTEAFTALLAHLAMLHSAEETPWAPTIVDTDAKMRWHFILICQTSTVVQELIEWITKPEVLLTCQA